MLAQTCPTCGGWLDAGGRCTTCAPFAPPPSPVAYTAPTYDPAPDGRASGVWPAWAIALLSLACNPLLLVSILAITRAREELSTARLLEADGDTARAGSLRMQAWLAIGLASAVPVVACLCLGTALLLNIAGAASHGGSGY